MNFGRTAPMALPRNARPAGRQQVDTAGIALAIASGALPSGIGYVVWYAALRGLTALRAATVQLSVPPLAAFGGVLWLGETITPRLVGASIAILGGIALVLSGRAVAAPTRTGTQ